MNFTTGRHISKGFAAFGFEDVYCLLRDTEC